MAVYTVANGGGNINAGATYVGGVAPGTGDTIAFTATSGQLTVNTPWTIAGIDFTNYVNTLTMSAALTVNGNVTLVAGMTISGTSGLTVGATATLTSNGKTWSNALSFIGTSQTFTFFDNWTIGGTLGVGGATPTVNGSTLTVQGGLTLNAAGGITNSNIILAGTGTWSGSGTLKGNLTINTAGTITISGTVAYNTGTFTYISGNVGTSGSTLNCSLSTTLNTNGINWDNVSFSGSSTTITFSSDFYCNNISLANNGLTLNGSNIYIYGNINQNAITGVGSSVLVYIGNLGILSGAAGNILKNNLTINTSGTLIMSGNIGYQTGTMNILKGKILNRNNSSLTIYNTCTLLNIHKCSFKTVTVSSNQTITMNEFFSGTPENKTLVRITGGVSPYKIIFTDNVPKKAFHVNVQYCALFTNPNQLNVINRDGNAGFNSGILFGERGMDGFALNQYPIENSYTYQDGFKNTLNY